MERCRAIKKKTGKRCKRKAAADSIFCEKHRDRETVGRDILAGLIGGAAIGSVVSPGAGSVVGAALGSIPGASSILLDLFTDIEDDDDS